MDSYNLDTKCPKCGCNVLRTAFHDESYEDDACSIILCSYPGQAQHIIRECARCGHEFFQRPLDVEGEDMEKLTREITWHHDSHGLTESLRIKADEPGPGGASHYYQVDQEAGIGRRLLADIKFQSGPRNDPNSQPGIVEGVLLAILIDRLSAFQAGPYACEENDEALKGIESALAAVKRRANNRAERGVLGTTAK